MPANRQTRAEAVQRDPRWVSLCARDRAADGRFVYAVSTTGVYCRPSCAARTPRPEHVRFYANPAAALRAGFRACKRCQPDAPAQAERHAATIAQLCRLLDARDEVPTLAELGRAVGLSPFYAQRLFKAVTGVTPRAYAAARRAERARATLAGSGSVTEAIFAAGYGSSGRFYADAPARLGMTPTAYRAKGAKQTIGYAVGTCSLGRVLVAATARGLCAIALGDDPQALIDELARRFARAQLGLDPALARRLDGVIAQLEQPDGVAGLPLDIQGTVFQQRVWQALLRIPAGATVTYAELAATIGAPTAVRAVAQACAANPLAVAIPCHRVLRSDGELAGYRWGLARKRQLLARERGR